MELCSCSQHNPQSNPQHTTVILTVYTTVVSIASSVLAMRLPMLSWTLVEDVALAPTVVGEEEEGVEVGGKVGGEDRGVEVLW